MMPKVHRDHRTKYDQIPCFYRLRPKPASVYSGVVQPSSAARIAAALVALVTWAGLAIQLTASITMTGGSLLATLWEMARYFTVVTNLLVALTFSTIAAGMRAANRPFFIGGVMLLILLVGVIYWLLLRGLLELSGGAKLADAILHSITPIIALFWWLAFAPKGRLDWRAPLLWATVPLAYLPYAIARGLADGKFPYPFINIDKLGWSHTLANAAGVALGFLVAGYLVVRLDTYLGRHRQSQ